MSVTTSHPGTRLVAEFLASHEHFSRYHGAALALAANAATDAEAASQLARVVARYVQHLHIHHMAEEHELFPAIRSAAPALGGAVDTLLDQHRELASQLDNVAARLVAVTEAAAGSPELRTAVDALTRALHDLHDVVAAHLAFEEATTVPVIDTWARWPF